MLIAVGALLIVVITSALWERHSGRAVAPVRSLEVDFHGLGAVFFMRGFNSCDHLSVKRLEA